MVRVRKKLLYEPLKARVAINTFPAPPSFSLPCQEAADLVVLDKARLDELIAERDDLLAKYNTARKQTVCFSNQLREHQRARERASDRKTAMLGPKPVDDELVTSFCSRDTTKEHQAIAFHLYEATRGFRTTGRCKALLPVLKTVMDGELWAKIRVAVLKQSMFSPSSLLYQVLSFSSIHSP